MDRVRKKLREARFFQRRMSERKQMACGDHEEFDFYLSALLSAQAHLFVSESTDWKYQCRSVARNISDYWSGCLRIIVVLKESLLEGRPTKRCSRQSGAV